MSQLVYNGVSLQVVVLKDYLQENVFTDDGADLLYVHHRLHVRAVFGPGSTTGPVAGMAGVMEALMTPRQQLLYGVGGDTQLTSPSVQGASCDANNGPHPIACTVLEFHGDKSAVVEFVVETWIADTKSAVIGHRWSMTEDLDEQFYSTRTTEGEAVFRSDFIQGTNLTADKFRAVLVQPIPAGYRRAPVSVTADSDGLRYRYRIVDEQQTLSLGSGPVVKIEATYDTGNKCNTDLVNAGPTFATSWAKMSVRVWGSRTSTRNDLVTAIATAMAAYALPNTLGGGGKIKSALGVESHLSVDCVGKYAECEIGWLSGGMGDNLKMALPGTGGAGVLVISFPEDLGNYTLAPGVCPQARSANGTRTDTNVALITQALTNPGSKPVLPGKA